MGQKSVSQNYSHRQVRIQWTQGTSCTVHLGKVSQNFGQTFEVTHVTDYYLVVRGDGETTLGKFGNFVDELDKINCRVSCLLVQLTKGCLDQTFTVVVVHGGFACLFGQFDFKVNRSLHHFTVRSVISEDQVECEGRKI